MSHHKKKVPPREFPIFRVGSLIYIGGRDPVKVLSSSVDELVVDTFTRKFTMKASVVSMTTIIKLMEECSLLRSEGKLALGSKPRKSNHKPKPKLVAA